MRTEKLRQGFPTLEGVINLEERIRDWLRKNVLNNSEDCLWVEKKIIQPFRAHHQSKVGRSYCWDEDGFRAWVFEMFAGIIRLKLRRVWALARAREAGMHFSAGTQPSSLPRTAGRQRDRAESTLSTIEVAELEEHPAKRARGLDPEIQSPGLNLMPPEADTCVATVIDPIPCSVEEFDKAVQQLRQIVANVEKRQEASEAALKESQDQIAKLQGGGEENASLKEENSELRRRVSHLRGQLDDAEQNFKSLLQLRVERLEKNVRQKRAKLLLVAEENVKLKEKTRMLETRLASAGEKLMAVSNIIAPKD
jgi:hypothetical protein